MLIIQLRLCCVDKLNFGWQQNMATVLLCDFGFILKNRKFNCDMRPPSEPEWTLPTHLLIFLYLPVKFERALVYFVHLKTRDNKTFLIAIKLSSWGSSFMVELYNWGWPETQTVFSSFVDAVNKVFLVIAERKDRHLSVNLQNIHCDFMNITGDSAELKKLISIPLWMNCTNNVIVTSNWS